jgi:hypothetical protein
VFLSAVIYRFLIIVILCVIAACFPSCADKTEPALNFRPGVTYEVKIGHDGKLYHVPITDPKQ